MYSIFKKKKSIHNKIISAGGRILENIYENIYIWFIKY